MSSHQSTSWAAGGAQLPSMRQATVPSHPPGDTEQRRAVMV
jgi:hypothetical protein